MIKIGGIEIDEKVIPSIIIAAVAVGLVLGFSFRAGFDPSARARECKQRLSECQDELQKCKKRLTRAKTIATILPIASFGLQIPGAINETIQFVTWLQNEKDRDVDTDSTLDYISDNQRQEIDSLVKGYWHIERDVRYSEDVKIQYRKQTVAETCRVLRASANLRDEKKDFSNRVESFCQSLPLFVPLFK